MTLLHCNIFSAFCLLFCSMQHAAWLFLLTPLLFLLSFHECQTFFSVSHFSVSDSHCLFQLLPLYLYKHTGNNPNNSLALIICRCLSKGINPHSRKCSLDRLLHWLTGNWIEQKHIWKQGEEYKNLPLKCVSNSCSPNLETVKKAFIFIV